jgi:iron complex transport system substrate-binding protein
MFQPRIVLASMLALAACAAPAPAAPAMLSTPAAPTAAPQPTATPAPTALPAPTSNLTDACVDVETPGVDYFPAKASITQTDGFSIEYHDTYKLLTVKTPAPGATAPLTYVLVQCGTEAPAGFEPAQIITVPVQRVVAMSTTYLPVLDELGLLDRLVGVDDATYTFNQKVVDQFAAGKLKAIGSGAGLNLEAAIELKPDLILTFGSGSADFDSHPKLLEAGLKVVLNAEWLDTSPLGRAEWGKFIAVFFNQEAAAEDWFTEIADRYAKVKAIAASAGTPPKLAYGTPYQGTWYLPGGASFAAQLIRDAGATYPYAADTSTASLPLSFEEAYSTTRDAAYWINLPFVPDLAALLAQDSRFAEFEAYKNGKVWNNDLRSNAAGGSDYYESAVVRPDLVLADLVAIVHPDKMPGHKFYYYRQLK